MSLALLTACLLIAPPAQAQQPPSHYWQITYTNSNTYYTHTPQGGTSAPVSGSWPAVNNGYSVGNYGDINSSVNGTVTATLTWIPATGKTLATDPPSEPVYIKETVNVSESSAWTQGGTAPGGGSVSDGLGDAPVVSSTSQNASGVHLLQRDGSSGTIVPPAVTLSASSPTSTIMNNGTPNWINSLVSVSFSAVVDTRAVAISSSLGQTYHRELDATQKPIRVADVSGSDGTARATTLRPYTGSSLPISYFVHAYGNWTNGSRYLLHCSSGDPGGSNYGNGDQVTITGQFSLPSDPICFLTMHYGSTATSEHAYAHLIDYGDGADGTANEYVTFHTNYEDWYKDPSKTIVHPLPLVSGGVVNASGIGSICF